MASVCEIIHYEIVFLLVGSLIFTQTVAQQFDETFGVDGELVLDDVKKSNASTIITDQDGNIYATYRRTEDDGFSYRWHDRYAFATVTKYDKKGNRIENFGFQKRIIGDNYNSRYSKGTLTYGIQENYLTVHSKGQRKWGVKLYSKEGKELKEFKTDKAKHYIVLPDGNLLMGYGNQIRKTKSRKKSKLVRELGENEIIANMSKTASGYQVIAVTEDQSGKVDLRYHYLDEQLETDFSAGERGQKYVYGVEDEVIYIPEDGTFLWRQNKDWTFDILPSLKMEDWQALDFVDSIAVVSSIKAFPDGSGFLCLHHEDVKRSIRGQKRYGFVQGRAYRKISRLDAEGRLDSGFDPGGAMARELGSTFGIQIFPVSAELTYVLYPRGEEMVVRKLITPPL